MSIQCFLLYYDQETWTFKHIDSTYIDPQNKMDGIALSNLQGPATYTLMRGRPLADCSVNKTNCLDLYDTLSFIDLSKPGNGANITQWQWFFDDNNSSSLQTLHTLIIPLDYIM